MRGRTLLLVLVAAAGGVVTGYWAAHFPKLPFQLPGIRTEAAVEQGSGASSHAAHAAPAPSQERRVLYWYDPMYPQQHFDQPGKSPFMDMELVPKYADEAEEGAGTVRIDPSIAQNLGMRTALVGKETLSETIEAVGTLAYNDRDVSIVQPRKGGYVERVYRLAPGDVIAKGAPLADLLVPEWAGAQHEFLALLRTGEANVIQAARERLHLLGMPSSLIAHLERTRTPRPIYTVTTPAGGVIESLEVRAGMSVSEGETLATVKGIDPVWLEIAVPEAQGSIARLGDRVEARLTAFPSETFAGKVVTVLPAANVETRTITLRVELENDDGRLRPGMFATVRIDGQSKSQRLVVPTEAIIRTGKRSLVMVAEDAGRYRPVEVTPGRTSNGKTEVLSGLEEGQRVVTSGQFLIDSEASLAGVLARLSEPQPEVSPPLHEADGTVVAVSASEVKLDHGPFTTLNMPGMTMTFPLARPQVAQGIEPGERVRVGARETDHGLIIEKITPIDHAEMKHD